jgi:predicted RNase H-like HicB family nuclease
MNDYPLVVIPLSEDDGGGFLAYAPDLPGCMSDGETAPEAIRHAEDAVTEWLAARAAQGEPVPKPGSAGEQANERERRLLDALRSLAEYNQSADRKIKGLERKLAELIALLREDVSRPRIGIAVSEPSRPSGRAPH